MKKSLLREAILNPDKEILWNSDERLGEPCSVSFNDLKKLMIYYKISNRELLEYDIRPAIEERRPYGE